MYIIRLIYVIIDYSIVLTGEIVPVSGSMKMDDWDNKALRLIITKPTTDTNIYCALTITVSISPDPIDFSLRQNNMPATTNTTLTITIDNSTLVGAIDLFNINNFQDLIISNISVHSGISNTSE